MLAFIDTNIILYAAGSPSPMKEPCCRILEGVATGGIEATTNTEVVQEVLHFFIRRGLREQGIEIARSLCTLFSGILHITPMDMVRASDFLENFHGLEVRDAVHVATMVSGGLNVIVSSDKHFDSVPGIQRIDPLNSAAVATLFT